jgi:hypothetical protein
MKKTNFTIILKFWKNLIYIGLILLLLQFFTSYIAEKNVLPISYVIGHIFIFSITGLSYTFYIKLKKSYASISGIIYGGLSMLKMLLAAIYLLPILLDSGEKDLIFIIEFMLIYFTYLFYETYVLLKELK